MMSYCQLLTVVLFLTFSTLCLATDEKPDYLECVNGEDCGPGKCCMLGMSRFSTPTCLPYAQVTEPCRPYDSGPINMTVSYPDGARVNLKSIHLQFCPCSSGLLCSLISLTCFEPNALENEISVI